MRCCNPGRGTCPLIASAKTGSVNAEPIHRRRVISACSEFGSACAPMVSRSSAIPHSGQLPRSVLPDLGMHGAGCRRGGRSVAYGANARNWPPQQKEIIWPSCSSWSSIVAGSTSIPQTGLTAPWPSGPAAEAKRFIRRLLGAGRAFRRPQGSPRPIRRLISAPPGSA
jgi:hypothetical protein